MAASRSSATNYWRIVTVLQYIVQFPTGFLVWYVGANTIDYALDPELYLTAYLFPPHKIFWVAAANLCLWPLMFIVPWVRPHLSPWVLLPTSATAAIFFADGILTYDWTQHDAFSRDLVTLDLFTCLGSAGIFVATLVGLWSMPDTDAPRLR